VNRRRLQTYNNDIQQRNQTHHTSYHKFNRELTTNNFCHDFTSILGVYTDVIFAEYRGLSPCLGAEEDISNVMVVAFYQTTVSQLNQSTVVWI